MNPFLQPQVVLGSVFLLYATIGLFAFWSSKMQKKGGINRLLPTVVVGGAGVALLVAAPLIMGTDMCLMLVDVRYNAFGRFVGYSMMFSLIGGFFLLIVSKAMTAQVLISYRDERLAEEEKAAVAETE